MVNMFCFSTSGITTPIKLLGMVFSSPLRDATSINSIYYNEETRLLEKFIAWLCQHGKLTRILVSLLLYKVTF